MRIKCPRGHVLIAGSHSSGRKKIWFRCPYCKADYPRTEWVLLYSRSKKIRGFKNDTAGSFSRPGKKRK